MEENEKKSETKEKPKEGISTIMQTVLSDLDLFSGEQ